jgi:hypothetical protein
LKNVFRYETLFQKAFGEVEQLAQDTNAYTTEVANQYIDQLMIRLGRELSSLSGRLNPCTVSVSKRFPLPE